MDFVNAKSAIVCQLYVKNMIFFFFIYMSAFLTANSFSYTTIIDFYLSSLRYFGL